MAYDTVADADTLILDDVIRIALRRAFEEQVVAISEGQSRTTFGSPEGEDAVLYEGTDLPHAHPACKVSAIGGEI